jgi:hypothetical protein
MGITQSKQEIKLLSMTDFVLGQEITIEVQSLGEQWSSRVSRYNKISSYAKLLKQPLELWMFVPCDEDGNFLEEPKHYKSTIIFIEGERRKYQQAKERCLFEGYLFSVNKLIGDFQEILVLPFSNRNVQFHITDFTKENQKSKKVLTVEDLVKYDLQLTETACSIFSRQVE